MMQEKRRRALVVCDLFFAQALSARLNALGWESESADSLEAVCEALADRPPDLLVVHAGFPDIDWVSIVRRATNLSPRPTVVAFAGHREVQTIQEARRLGCDLVTTNAAITSQLFRLLASLPKVEQE